MINRKDKGYNKKLLQLLTPPNPTTNGNNYSHWLREDKIVFCPVHLYDYVEKNFAEIYI
jgi:hypothetical protein